MRHNIVQTRDGPKHKSVHDPQACMIGLQPAVFVVVGGGDQLAGWGTATLRHFGDGKPFICTLHVLHSKVGLALWFYSPRVAAVQLSIVRLDAV